MKESVAEMMGQFDLKRIMIVGAEEAAYDFAYASIVKGIADEYIFIDNDEIDKNIVKNLNFAAMVNAKSKVSIGSFKQAQNSDLLVITATETRLEAESDNDYLKRNIQLVRKTVNQAMENGFKGLILVATRPTDIFTYLVWKFSGLPKKQVIGLGTFFDTIYFEQLISDYFEVSKKDVRAYVAGGSAVQHKVPIWSRSVIAGSPVLGYVAKEESDFNQEQMTEMNDKVVKRHLDKTEESSGFAVGFSLTKLLGLIQKNEKGIVPVCHVQDFGEYENVPLSLPSIVGVEGVTRFPELGLSDFEKQDILIVAKELKERLEQIEKGNL